MSHKPTPLTNRAQAYLADWKRYPAVPTEKVEKSLIEAGLPTYKPWLDFHERYAGYETHIGRDGMVLGLMHEKLIYFDFEPMELTLTEGDEDSDAYIYCADAHPSYKFELDHLGGFLHSPNVSFDMFIEQSAAFVEFRALGQITNHWTHGNTELHEQISNQAVKDKELSDQYLEHWIGEKIFAVRDVKEDSWLTIMTVDPSRTGEDLHTRKPQPPSEPPPPLTPYRKFLKMLGLTYWY